MQDAILQALLVNASWVGEAAYSLYTSTTQVMRSALPEVQVWEEGEEFHTVAVPQHLTVPGHILHLRPVHSLPRK